MTELKPEETLEAILSVLLDIGDMLSEITESKRADLKAETVHNGVGDALWSDGGVNFATGTTKTFRTYGDPTVLSGDEEGLK